MDREQFEQNLKPFCDAAKNHKYPKIIEGIKKAPCVNTFV
jgi:hypothetical protein